MMKNRNRFILWSGIVAAVLLIIYSTTLLVTPWLSNKIEEALKENNSGYIVTIGKVSTSIIPSGIKLDTVKIETKAENAGIPEINGKIASVKVNGINLFKAIFRKEINIREINISGSSFSGHFSSLGDSSLPVLLPINIHIGVIHFDNINLSFKNSSNNNSWSVKDGTIVLYDVKPKKNNTISFDILSDFDVSAGRFISVSSDTIYKFIADGIAFSSASNTMTIDSISAQPAFANYDFTSRYEFQKNRFEVHARDIFAYDFDFEGFFSSRDLISSFVEAGNIEMKIFRDNRKEFHHIKKTIFQDIIYNYKGIIRIDSIALPGGNITYTEHSLNANEPGYLTFNKIDARIYKLNNDTIYKTNKGFLEIKTNALLMGKSKVYLNYKGRIYDPENRFTLDGTLSAMEGDKLNPYLEKRASVRINSGTIDGMNFSFIADNANAKGKMNLLYHGLDLAVLNKKTDKSTAFKERFISFFANMKVPDSNPLPGKEVREGTIYFERDPERSLLHYCGKSIISGVRSSLERNN
jgi:hypothetical protein